MFLVPILIQPEDWMQWIWIVFKQQYRSVPILIQPEDWMQLILAKVVGLRLEVPILIQPEDWMQYCYFFKNVHDLKPVPILIQPEDWMQYLWVRHQMSEIGVPILIQPEDWMQYYSRSIFRRVLNLFQSSSSPKTGCNFHYYRSYLVGCAASSNPHPARRLDAMADILNWLISTSSIAISAILLFLISLERST